MTDLWKITEDTFDPQKQHHKETIFTIGNGYLCTRGAFEEGFPGDRRATFAHGVFDAVPISITELANAPDWLPFTVLLDGERFSLATGKIKRFSRSLDLHTGTLSRTVEWVSPQGRAATLIFERFTSLADEHTALIRCQVTPDFEGTVEFRASLNGNTDNEGVTHWRWIAQGQSGEAVYLHNRTRKSGIDYASAMRLVGVVGNRLSVDYWDVENVPTLAMKMAAVPGKTLIVDKFAAVATSRETQDPLKMALEHVNAIVDWPAACEANAVAWEGEWERTDVVIEGEIGSGFTRIRCGRGPDRAALQPVPDVDRRTPSRQSNVNIGAKTLSGFGYRGHSFWDTEIFMLPLFIYTAPHIARNLLNYRYQRLPAARAKAKSNGYEGAQFPWESADTGEEVTPTWVPHFADRNKLVRIWTGDIEIHISADVALAAHKYWQVTGDDAWFIEQGAELILDTAKFWASRAEWNAELNRYEYNDVIGPDENHEHVNNNAYTNRMAQWNIQFALDILDWLKEHAPDKAAESGGAPRFEHRPAEPLAGGDRQDLSQCGCLWLDRAVRGFLPAAVCRSGSDGTAHPLGAGNLRHPGGQQYPGSQAAGCADDAVPAARALHQMSRCASITTTTPRAPITPTAHRWGLPSRQSWPARWANPMMPTSTLSALPAPTCGMYAATPAMASMPPRLPAPGKRWCSGLPGCG